MLNKKFFALPIALIPLYANAESANDSSAENAVEEIVVTATRTQYQIETPSLVTVISADDIARSGASNVVDVIRNQGGVHITDLFGDGSRPSVSVRGFGENAAQHALVLVNGRKLNNPDLGAPDLNSVALKDVERIEIVEGSASTLYGDQAVGGVINIITRKGRADESHVHLRVGSYNLREVEAATRQTVAEGWRVSASALTRKSDNYRDHNKADYNNVWLSVEHAGERHTQQLELNYVDDFLETPGALTAQEAADNRRQVSANYVDDFIDTQTVNARLGFSGRLADNWDYEVDVTTRDSDGEFLQSFSFSKETVVSTQDRNVWTFNPRLIGYVSTSAGQALWVTGVDYEDTDYLLVTRFGQQRSKQRVTSVYTRVVQPLSDDIEMTYGARYASSENEVFDGFKFATETPIDDDVWGGELGFKVAASDNTSAYGRIERVYRFGKVDEHTTFASTSPLEPTTGYSYELGVEHNEGFFSSNLALWQIDLENEIAFDPNSFDNVNLPPTRRLGLTAIVSAQVSDSTGLSLSGSTVDATVQSGSFEGKDVPLVPSYNVRVAVDQQLTSHLHLLVEWQAVGKRAASGDFNNNAASLDSYRVVNTALGWTANAHDVTLRVNNVLDAEYAEFGSSDGSVQPSPELNANVSYRYRF